MFNWPLKHFYLLKPTHFYGSLPAKYRTGYLLKQRLVSPGLPLLSGSPGREKHISGNNTTFKRNVVNLRKHITDEGVTGYT